MTQDEQGQIYALAWDKYRQYRPADIVAMAQSCQLTLNAMSSQQLVSSESATARETIMIYLKALEDIMSFHVDVTKATIPPTFADYVQVPRIARA